MEESIVDFLFSACFLVYYGLIGLWAYSFLNWVKQKEKIDVPKRILIYSISAVCLFAFNFLVLDKLREIDEKNWADAVESTD